MDLATQRVSEILGLPSDERNVRDVAAAVERGLSLSALERTVARAGLTGKAREALLHSVVPRTTWKRRSRLTLPESEKTERLARVIAFAEILWEEPTAAQAFLGTPHPQLDQRTPLECANSELGARRVEDVVQRALYGLPA